MKTGLWLALAATIAAHPAAAADEPSDAARFGAREAISQMSLSPDGERLAMISPAAGRGNLVLVTAIRTGASKVVLRSSGDPEQLRSCRWSAATRLICTLTAVSDASGIRLGFTRIVALNADGSDLKLLSTPDSSRAVGIMQDGGRPIDWSGAEGDGSVLMTRSFVPENATGTHLASSRRGLGVDRVDTVTLSRSTVEQPNAFAVDYITDGKGAVRVRATRSPTSSGQMGSTVEYGFRRSGSRQWERLSRYDIAQRTGFDPYAVDRDLNVVYGFDRLNGRRALFRIALDGSGKRELVMARPDVDVDGLIRVGRQNRVVGVSWATDRRQTEFFDPELKKLSASLGKALPGLPLVSFVDASADEKTLLLFAGSDDDPGRYFLYHKEGRRLEEVLPVRHQLAGMKLATVKPVSYPAADGTTIPGYLTLPPGSDGRGLPAIVMPHGGPGARDEWGFDWLSQYFAARGFAVLQPNFRGSTGYGDAWFQKNGFQSWKIAIGDVNDAGRWLVSQGIADPAKLGIVGWSYGGYAALQSAVVNPDLFKAIVAIAPVTDLETLRNESRNYTNFSLVSDFIGQGAHVREGSPAQNARRITAPVLLVHGTRDQNVGVGESRLMASRLKAAGRAPEYLEYKGLDHYLDDAAARTEMLTRADALLRRGMKM